MKTLYISGKISHLPEITVEENFEAAEQEVSKRIMLGIAPFHGNDRTDYYILNPLNIRPLLGVKKWMFYMINDLRKLHKSDTIFMQKNWIDSRGACVEHYFAKFIFKIKVVYL